MTTKKKTLITKIIHKSEIPSDLPELAIDMTKLMLRAQLEAMMKSTPGCTIDFEVVEEDAEPTTKTDEATAERLLQSVRSEFAANDGGQARSRNRRRRRNGQRQQGQSEE